MMQKTSVALVVTAGFVLAAATPPKTTSDPAQPVSAKTAFWEMYKPARTWATDLLVLSVSNSETGNIKCEAGKCVTWTAVFVSPSRRAARTFTYSVAASGNTPKGISAGVEQRWTGSTPQIQAFRSGDFSIDSDAAYDSALKKAGAWVKQHPGKPVSLTLGSASRFSVPVWYIVWGSKTSGYAVFVNAVSGAVISK
jgi:hypothetical protein